MSQTDMRSVPVKQTHWALSAVMDARLYKTSFEKSSTDALVMSF